MKDHLWIAAVLSNAFLPCYLQVVDTSDHHSGHVHGDRVASHFSIKVVSDVFCGLTALARHRWIYRLLQVAFLEGLHALSIEALSPEEVMSLAKRAKQVLSPVLARYTELEIVAGGGCEVIAKDGKYYLDFASGIGVASTGHCHPEVVAAIQLQASTLIHAGFGIMYYEKPVVLAEKLGALLGKGLDSVFFCQSGTEAVEAAIKLAKYTTRKSKILAFQGGFHGRTLGALSLTTSKMTYRDGYEPLLPGVSFFPYPYCYRCPFGKERSSCDTTCIQDLQQFMDSQAGDVAAVIIEPILGEGGYTQAPIEFMQALRQMCTEKGILLILDEIQSGFCKTGSWFGFQQLDIVPDILTLAKGIASGLPLGACVTNQELAQKWHKGAHGGTYGANPITCAAAIATLDVLSTYVGDVDKKGQQAVLFLRESLATHPYVGDIRQWGLMIGIEFVLDKTSKTPAKALIKQIMATCLEQQLILISCGIEDNVIRLVPPLIISEKQLMEGLGTFVRVCNQYV